MRGLEQTSSDKPMVPVEFPDAMGRHFGWASPPLAQLRERLLLDNAYALKAHIDSPRTVDLREFCPQIYSQGSFNTCSAQAVAALIQILRNVGKLVDVMPSRMFLYYFARVKKGQTTVDNGISISEILDALLDRGYCREALWAYTQENLSAPPSMDAITDAKTRTVHTKVPLNDLSEIKASIADHHPVAFGVTIFNTFFLGDNNQGIVPMPVDGDGPSKGHAGLLVGYDDGQQLMTMRSSWGTTRVDGKPCGDKGYYYLPYEYVDSSYASDFWTIQKIFS